jgi:hypothetical protein
VVDTDNEFGKIINAELHKVEKWFYEPEEEQQAPELQEYIAEFNRFSLIIVLYYIFRSPINDIRYSIHVNKETRSLYLSENRFDSDEFSSQKVWDMLSKYEGLTRQGRNWRHQEWGGWNYAKKYTYVIAILPKEPEISKDFRQVMFRFLSDADFRLRVFKSVERYHNDYCISRAERKLEEERAARELKWKLEKQEAINRAKYEEEAQAEQARLIAEAKERARLKEEKEQQEKLKKKLENPDDLIDEIANSSRKRQGKSFLGKLFG